MSKQTCIRCGMESKEANSPREKKLTRFIRGLCRSCYQWAKSKDFFEEIALPPKGNPPTRELWSTYVDQGGYVRIRTPKGLIGQHRHVMEQNLGRDLVPGENVHHINGVRDDNRIENLELWFSAQPYGQRVYQLIDYMAEFHAGKVAAKAKALANREETA